MKRLLTGIVYILILLGAFLLRRYVHLLFFDALVLLFSLLGTWEMLRAFGDRIDRAQKTLVLLFSSGIIVCYAAADTVYRRLQETRPEIVNYSPLITFVVFMAGLALLFGLLVFRHEKTSLESLGCSLICYLYPSVFLLVLTGATICPTIRRSAFCSFSSSARLQTVLRTSSGGCSGVGCPKSSRRR